ncbi:MAG: hypothetical protein JWO98_4105 [Frankiales bacterium]|nr:hypothetical protein [Frankiales bacterium]
MAEQPRPPEPDPADPYDVEHRVVFPAEGQPDRPAPATPSQRGPLTAAGAAPLIRKVIH